MNLRLRNEFLSWLVMIPLCGVRDHSLVTIQIRLIFATFKPGSIAVQMIPLIYGVLIAEVVEDGLYC